MNQNRSKQPVLLPDLTQFIDRVASGRPHVVEGVYAEDALALPVIQQPEFNVTYVSNREGVLTQFQLAARHQTLGFLAHSFLAGKLIHRLRIGQVVSVVYGNRRVCQYQVTGKAQFQKLSPNRRHSDFLDLRTGERYTTERLFNRFYKDRDLVFQTCIEKGDQKMWGVLFVVAQGKNS